MSTDGDTLVIGGGTAGCILAARLSEDPARRVTLLEAGPEDRHPWIHIPAGYARMLVSKRYDWGFATEPEPALDGRRIVWPRGRVLGGSGSVNGLVFLRGSPHDYDRWAQAGARGWSWADVRETFRRLESWEGPPGESRGREGPVPVSTPRRLSDAAAAFVETCVGMGYPRHRDINDGAIEGVAPIQMNVRRGRRVSTARAYLRPARGRANLRVLTGITVLRLLVEGGRVAGCVGRRADGSEAEFRARETVLAAGAVASPALLLRSGIGDGEALRALGIPLAAHAPGVGRNLQDHLIARATWRMRAALTRSGRTMNELTATRLGSARMAAGYALTRAGPMAVGATEATLFARLTPGAEEAEAQLQFVNFSLEPGGGYVLPKYPGVMINFGQCRPDSRGTVSLRSPDPDAPPLIRPNYLDAPGDRRVMLDAARLALAIGRAAPFADLAEAQLSPDPAREDDDALLAHLRATAGTVYHPCGTCRMGTDASAVVDPSLSLRALPGLRIADASVMPLVPSSNIQPAVMMIAERAAALIRAG